MTKIALVANTDWYLYNFRSALVHYLSETGHDVLLISPGGEFIHELEKEGYRWIEWPVDRKGLNPWREGRAVQHLTSIYRKEKPDLVHHFTIKPVLYGMLAARMAGIPSKVNSITGLGYLFLQQGRLAEARRAVVTRIYRWALQQPRTAIIFENVNDRDYFIEKRMADPRNTFIIQGVGVDVNRFLPGPEPDGCPVVVLPARLLWDKGVGTLVEAARILRTRISARIALVGQPDPGNPASVGLEDIHKWVEEGLVEYWGFHRDMVEVYRSAHIVTLPSFGEGLPTALIEAGACARPVVTTDVSGCRDVVTDSVNGLIVPPNDPIALADAIERLLVDANLRKEMGAAGRRIVLEHFTTARVNSLTFDVYRQLLNPVPTPH